MSLDLIVKQNTKGKRISIEMDAGRLERLAASFGFLNPNFLQSLDRAERDFASGKYRKIKSLHDLK